jgi:hypothetical protein
MPAGEKEDAVRKTIGRCLATVLLLISGWALSGCSSSEPSAWGTVRVDGEPLASGSITFVPVDGKGETADDHGPGGGTTIKEGTYRIERGKGLKVGRYRVEIQGIRTTPRKVLDPLFSTALVQEEAGVLPAEYNKKSTLFREVSAGVNKIDFDDLKGTRKSR